MAVPNYLSGVSQKRLFIYLSQMKMSLNSILKDDESFLKEFLKGFYRQIIKIEYYDNFGTILMEWTKDFFGLNKKSSKTVLKLMENHEENENWFSSLIGFFYEHGISDDNIIDKTNL